MEPKTWEAGLPEFYSQFSTSPEGLDSHEAKARLKQYGPNAIPDKDKREWFDILFSQFASPLLLILIFASIISAFVGDIFDTIIILAIILASVLLGFVQEYKSEKVLSELKNYLSHTAVVLRDREKKQIDARELVPGDIVFVGLGDIVPADMRIIETQGIVVNEAALTGESRGVQKDALARPASLATPQDIKNGLFMGSTMLDGYAKAVVVATGQQTFFGKTAVIFSSKIPESDFQIGIRKFGSLLIRIIAVLTLFVFLSNFAMGHGDKNPLSDSALFALAIAVGVAPEALPAIITMTLSMGSRHLARKKVITKKLSAIEDLGNMDVLCTDKTGTLTEEGIRLEKFVDLAESDSHEIFQYAFVCNSAVGSTVIRGNPIDVAIRKAGLDRKVDVSHLAKIKEIPFDYERRRMSVVARERGKQVLIVKGAPESILSACTNIKMKGKLYDSSRKGAEIREMIAAYNRDGYTTIAVAYKELKAKQDYSKEDEKGLTFIGFVLLSNPPKPSVHETLHRLKSLNVRLKILTGDDPLVTRKLCASVGFRPDETRIVLGSELNSMSPAALADAAERYDIFARVSPEQKLAIVEALRSRGHVVGFMGDGINDAPALRAADVGISVNTAADVAKGASHIILLTKSLGVVCDGVEEGRKIFGNITKYILNTMSANQGNMLTIVLFSFVLPFMPLLPSQILLNNMLSDLPLLSISTDKVDTTYTKKPQKWNIKMLFRFMVFFGAISTIFDVLFIAILYFVMGVSVPVLRTAWFLMSVLTEMLIVFSLRTQLPFFRSMPSRILLLASVASMAVSIAVVYYVPIAALFHFEPLGADILLLTGGVLVCYFAATEIGKAFFFHRPITGTGS